MGTWASLAQSHGSGVPEYRSIQTGSLIWTGGPAALGKRCVLSLVVLSGGVLTLSLPGRCNTEHIMHNDTYEAYILQSERKILIISGAESDNPKGISSTTLPFDKHLVLKQLLSFKNENIENNHNRTHLFKIIYNIKKKNIALDEQRKNILLFLVWVFNKIQYGKTQDRETNEAIERQNCRREVGKIKKECG